MAFLEMVLATAKVDVFLKWEDLQEGWKDGNHSFHY